MLMTLLVVVGGALLAAFLAHAYLPRRFGRPIALLLGGPALALVSGAVGLALYSRTVCSEKTFDPTDPPDSLYVTGITEADCGDPATRSYDVSIARRDSPDDGKAHGLTVLRSRGKPAPVAVTTAGDRQVMIRFDDGSIRTVTLNDQGLPDRVWSIINGKVVHGDNP